MRYARPTHQFAVGDRVVTRIAKEWARCAADLAARGASYARPAGVLAGSTGPASGRRGRRLPGVIFAFCDTAGATNAVSCCDGRLRHSQLAAGLRTIPYGC
jgi:hypothetical protein